MNKYKNIILLCSSEICGNITDHADMPGFKFVNASSPPDFLKKMEDSHDAVIVSYDHTDENVLSALNSMSDVTPYAVVVDPDRPETVSHLLKNGIYCMLPVSDLKSSLSTFMEHVLALGSSDVLIKTLNRVKNLAANVSEGIIIVDDDGKIGYVNNSGEILLGLDRSNIIDRSIDDVLKGNPFAMEKHDKEPHFIENFEFENFKGQNITIDVTYTANYEDGEFAGAMLILNRVSASTMDKQKELELLKYQQRYHSIQQGMAFKKQMLVLKDEVSNMLAGDFFVETYFKPLDILSGDIYGSINIKDGRYLFYVIDAMGKGLSASVTSLQSSSFINHSLEISILKNDFDLEKTMTSFLYFIRERLMEEEALCMVYALLDTNDNTITLANYGMPPVYFTKDSGEIKVIRPNNLPIMRCISGKNIDTYSLDGVDKILIMSDGLPETPVKDGLYADFIETDLKKALTKKHLLSMINSRIYVNDDDITFFLIKKDTLTTSGFTEFVCDTSVAAISDMSITLTERLIKDGIPEEHIGTVEYAVSEILMNALEHGNIGLSFKDKQTLIAKGEYDDYLVEQTDATAPAKGKKIYVRYLYIPPEKDSAGAVIISITDEGQGFTPANIFKYHSFDGNLCYVDKESYNGRGIFITDNLLDGLYYNEKGNCAYLVKLIGD